MGVKKEDCQIGVQCIVNDKTTSWNTELGVENNGMHAFVYKKEGSFFTDPQFEIPIGTKVEIVDVVKRRANGSTVVFKIVDHERIYSAYWCCFKSKVNLI